ncbi:MAG: hypothetical protein ACM3JP_02865, partial [Betaproteobacteria bacterium]
SATLQGAADGIRRSLGADVWHIDRRSHADAVERLRSRLGTETYARLSGDGAALSIDDALNIARTAAARRPT